MEIRKDFFNEYSVKKLTYVGSENAVLFYLKMVTSPFFSDGRYHFVLQDRAVEQLAIEFETTESVVDMYLTDLDHVALITEYDKSETHSIKFNEVCGLS